MGMGRWVYELPTERLSRESSLINKRLLASLTVLPFIVLVSVAETTLSPPIPLTNYLYWSGFLVFFCIGAFVFLNVKVASRVGGLIFATVMFGLIAFSVRGYPQAGEIAAGFPGLLVGMGVEGFYKLFYK